MLSKPHTSAAEARAAAVAAADLIADGMTVGLGSGSTVALLIGVLASRRPRVRFVAASPASQALAQQAGLDLIDLPSSGLDLAVDGADQVAPSGWLLKGGGGAHTREKVLASAAAQFVVIISAEKLVARLQPPVALELLAFGIDATLSALEPTVLRAAAPTPDGGLLADYLGPIAEPADLARTLSATSGLVEHGLFPPELVDEVIVGHPTRAGATHLPWRRRAA